MAKRSRTTQPAQSNGRGDRIVTTNRRATHDYFIEESMETGLSLTGSEIKSIRNGNISIGEAYVRVDDDELWLIGANIAPFEHGGYANHDATRPRKLLARKRQIETLREQTERRGMTLVPLRVALRHGLAKLDIGVAKGKRLYDKRAASAAREADRDVQRALRERSRD